MGETKAQKAERLLLEGRLTVIALDPQRRAPIIAQVKGDSGQVYTLGWDAEKKEYRCTCDASAKFRRRCSHILALQKVVVAP